MTSIALNSRLILVAVQLVLVLVLCNQVKTATAAEPCPEPATSVAHDFESGAGWEMCWHIDSQLGPVLSKIFYSSPDSIPRQVMEELHVAGLLLHYDDALAPEDLVTEFGLGSIHLQILSATNCAGEILTDNNGNPALCKESYYKNTLTRYTTAEVLRRNAVTYTSHANIGTQLWSIGFELTEDGMIIPSVSLSGRINRYTQNAETGSVIDTTGTLPRFASNATLISVWRMDFNIDSSAENDVIDEVQFNSDQTTRVRRRIAIQRLSSESRRQVAAEVFRGWRVSDHDLSASTDGSNITRVGYYLDPQSAGYRYSSNRHNWARFQFFVTDNNACERTAINNQQRFPTCGDTLDDFIQNSISTNADDTSGNLTDPVAWYAMTSRFEPDTADWPVILSRKSSFKLMPFDWSAKSPFASNPATGQ